MEFLIFSTVAILLTLPLSPILSEIGLSVCPIMRGHGFLFGCSINATFIFGLLLANLVVGNGALFIRRKIQFQQSFGIELSVLLSIIFLFTSTAGMVLAHSLAVGSISEAGSPYGVQITAILISVGAAMIFSLVALLDYLLFRKSSQLEGMTSLAAKVTEGWNLVLLVGAPLFVLIGFFYFSVTLFDSQVAG